VYLLLDPPKKIATPSAVINRSKAIFIKRKSFVGAVLFFFKIKKRRSNRMTKTGRRKE
jgi:hypothetical protein